MEVGISSCLLNAVCRALFNLAFALTHLLMFCLHSTRARRALQRHPRDAKMAVVAVIPPFQANQPVAGLGFLARHWPPLQPAPAAGHPPPCCPDPAGRRPLADGTHRLDLGPLTSLIEGQGGGDSTKHAAKC